MERINDAPLVTQFSHYMQTLLKHRLSRSIICAHIGQRGRRFERSGSKRSAGLGPELGKDSQHPDDLLQPLPLVDANLPETLQPYGQAQPGLRGLDISRLAALSRPAKGSPYVVVLVFQLIQPPGLVFQYQVRLGLL